MLYIDKKFKLQIEKATSRDEIAALLQCALELEHATIPPYLTAAYTLMPGPNRALGNLVLDVAVEEMLHMAIIANLIKAIGGRPQMDEPAFIPKYPGPLPMQVGDSLEVGLRKFSKQLVRDVFMKIEEPTKPLVIPGGDVEPVPASVGPENADTIGEFYQSLIDKISQIGDRLFRNNPDEQLFTDMGFPDDQLFPIVDAESATRALNWIVTEGEGTPSGPFDDEREPAHYYRFEAIYRGRRLVRDSDFYSYTGGIIRFVSDRVYDMPDDGKARDYTEGSRARQAIDDFNLTYSNMLRVLQRAYDGHPENINEAIALMGNLRGLATRALRSTNPDTGKRGCLSFEYMPP